MSKGTVVTYISEYNCPIAKLDAMSKRRNKHLEKFKLKKVIWEDFERDLKKTKDEKKKAASTSSPKQL